MADHPSARLASYTAPFSFVGIDYFGPMEVTHGRSAEKRWGVLFTCLTTRAIHLEIAYTLDKSSCLMAIRNFIARRGTPLEIRTDNGTNFHGVNNELNQLRKNLQPDELRNKFDKIRWKFNPPAAPHMGGCWERLVRSVKKYLTEAMPMRKPNDEVLRCYLMEAENIINSRPLTYIPIEPGEDEALTPNHFLLGSSSGLKPIVDLKSDVYLLRKDWKMAQLMADHFWRRWTKEYLPDITRRTKWFQKVKPIEIDDVVVVMDERKRNSWVKGVVIDTIKAKNCDQVRQVIVKTADGTYTRPAAKVAVLDLKQDDSKQDSTGEACYEGENVENRQ